MRLLVGLLSLLTVAESWYSVKYYIGGGEEAKIASTDLTFAKPPSAMEVADLCVRLSGLQSKSRVSVDESMIPRLETKDRELPFIFVGPRSSTMSLKDACIAAYHGLASPRRM